MPAWIIGGGPAWIVMSQLPETFAKLEPESSFYDADDIAIKQMVVKAGLYVKQHIHEYDHITLLAVGKVFVWKDGEEIGRVTAPDAIEIKAGVAHTFLAIEDSVLYCIHNVMGRDGIAAKEQ